MDIDKFILSYKILLRQDDNENFFVATIMIKKTIMTMKNPDQFQPKMRHLLFDSYQ